MTVVLFVYFTVLAIGLAAYAIEWHIATPAERRDYPAHSDALMAFLVWPGVALLLAFGLTLIFLHEPKE